MVRLVVVNQGWPLQGTKVARIGGVRRYVRLIYAIEGKTQFGISDSTLQSTFGKSPMKSANKPYIAAIIKTQLRDHISVLRTSTPQDTADYVDYIYHAFVNFELDTTMDSNDAKRNSGFGGAKRKRENMQDPIALSAHMLSVVPGVSLERAHAILGAFGNFQALSSATADDIASVACNTKSVDNRKETKYRRVGKAVGERIAAIFSNTS